MKLFNVFIAVVVLLIALVQLTNAQDKLFFINGQLITQTPGISELTIMSDDGKVKLGVFNLRTKKFRGNQHKVIEILLTHISKGHAIREGLVKTNNQLKEEVESFKLRISSETIKGNKKKK